MKCLLPLLCLIFISCSTPKTIALKGAYPTTPIEIASQKNFDEVWDKLIDLFAQKGLSIKLIDRSSGLIVSEGSALTVTIEDKNGIVEDPTAFIVVPKKYSPNSRKYYPITNVIFTGGPYGNRKVVYEPVYGEWNVRIKKAATGSTINVNIVNVNYKTLTSGLTSLNTYRTTGVFEKLIADFIK